MPPPQYLFHTLLYPILLGQALCLRSAWEEAVRSAVDGVPPTSHPYMDPHRRHFSAQFAQNSCPPRIPGGVVVIRSSVLFAVGSYCCRHGVRRLGLGCRYRRP